MRMLITAIGVTILSVVLVGCTSTGGGASASALASAAPSEAASVAPSEAAAPPSADPCAKDALTTLTPGTLTIGADNPAFPPYYQPPAEGETATDPWELGDPTNGQGFEAATAYAIAEALGFADGEVTWVPAPFNNVIQPGDKTFDMYLTQVSYSDERAQAVDLSDGYFDQNQAVVALAGTPIADVTTVAGLKEFKLAAPVGTTSLSYITDIIQPTTEPMVYDTLDASLQALGAGQVDGALVDLPTAFYITGAEQVENSVIVGSLPTAGAEVEHFSVLLDKDSPLTDCVNTAIAEIKASGELDAITQEWITGQGAPALTP